MNRFTAGLLFTLAFSLPSLAEEAPLKFAGYHLKNRSSFVDPATPRPPFWPIGWVHHTGVQQQVAAQPVVTLDPGMFSVTSILLGHPSLAVINGRAYGEGDALRSPRGKGSIPGIATAFPSVKVRVQKIDDGSVTLIAEGQKISIPMRHPELTEHKSNGDEDVLLSGDN